MYSLYEQFVFNRLQQKSQFFGYVVRRTPKSWDGGADLIIESSDANIVAIIQCKHVSDPGKTNEFSKDLERAFKNYECDRFNSVKKIGITNATKLTSEDKRWKDCSDDNICLYGQDGLKPENIFKFID